MNNTARILFYVTPKFKWKYVINWLISIRTWCKYSHCEVWEPDDGWFVYDSFNRVKCPVTGTCWTATMRGKANGSVSRDASLVLDHPENWHYIELEVPFMEAMIGYLKGEVAENKGYATWDILKFISPIHFDDQDRNICSEICNDALYMGGVLTKGGIISPGKLHKLLTEMGLETKSLADSGFPSVGNPTQKDIDNIVKEIE